jgi:carboxypeptidase D
MLTFRQVYDEDQMAADFVRFDRFLVVKYSCITQMGFLENFIKVFPDLATRPLYLTGESYAGMYIVSPTLP